MARKMDLAKTVPEEEIVISDEIVNKPNIVIDNEYGIVGNFRDYTLVKKTTAHRTGKEEDVVNCGKVIRYTKYVDVNYSSTLEGVMNNFLKIRTLEKTKELNMTGFEEVIAIYRETQEIIMDALHMCLGDSNSVVAQLHDDTSKMKKALSDVESVLREADKLHELCKEKRAIIIKDTEPKKHRMPKEED